MSAQAEVKPENFPDAYHPFLPVLERLTEPMLRILHGHLLSLEAILQSVQSQSHRAKGDFNGIGGLTLRGDINRIIQSELLLRSEAPLEFLRRVSEGETLYMEAEHSNPNEQIVYRVIISVGPYMLGHGRLLALASLMFLARAAQSRKAKLHWTYLPTDKQVNWLEGLSVYNVQKFLKFASFRDVNDEDITGAIEQWDAFNASLGSEGSKVQTWMIIAQAPASKMDAFNGVENILKLLLHPPLDDGARTGVLDLQLKGRNIRRLSINFPSDIICVSALNRPFNPQKPTQEMRTEGRGIISKGQGWEPCHVLSFNARNHVIRYEDGLLFLIIGKNLNDEIKSMFFEMPIDAKIAGIHFPIEGPAQILSQWNSPDEAIFYHEVDIRKAQVKHWAQKIITSKHLFAKQRKGAIPPMKAHFQMAKSYTTLGQAFEFSGIRDGKTSINILYKENRIIYADAKYVIVIFDPSKKTYQELKSFGKYMLGEEQGLTLVVLKNHSKVVAVYPCPEEVVENNFRGLSYTPSSHSLACVARANEWLIMGKNFEEVRITLAPYERLIRCHMTQGRCKMILFSNPEFGGDNTLKAVSSNDGKITGYDTVYNFDKISSELGFQNLVEFQILLSGGLRVVNLDENGTPDKLVLFRGIGEQQQPVIIDLEAELGVCERISYEAAHA